MSDLPEIPVETLAETERFTIWRAQEPDGETQYHIDMENITIHFYEEEWQEFLQILQKATQQNPGPNPRKKDRRA